MTEHKIWMVSDALNHRNRFKKEGRKVVFTNGCFDILHAGHVQYLNQAKALGDILIVGLNSDISVKTIKGSSRPINTQQDRALVLAGLQAVDAVIIFEEDTPINLIKQLKPDIHVKGGDYTPEQLVEAPIVTEYGGKIEILPFKPGNSTTKTIEKLKRI